MDKNLADALELAKRTNYTNKDIIYLKNVEIVEWDIRSAGFSVLKYKGAIPPFLIDEWEKLDKHTRSVREGNLQRANPNIASLIINTLADVRSCFVNLNGIKDYEILSIKKDAMFLINKRISHNKIFNDYFEFRKKGVYSSYVLLGEKEIYYSSSTNSMDIKGISEASREKCGAIIKDLVYLIRSGEKLNREQLFPILKAYRKKYLNRELPLDCYRELNNGGKFRIGKYTLEEIDESMRDDIDISGNFMNYINPIINILV